ncbi:hypothetical protein [Rhizobium sp.]|uniref:hypothetical protein n=1 Tax=Rhizobium sp. TaxID=391 RepID=UPI0028AA7511
MDLLNPLQWLAAIFGPILRWLGLVPPPQADGYENLSRADVDEAAEQATRTEEAVDAIMQQMSPADVVSAYAKASPEGRAEMDLRVFDAEGMDWLLGLSEDDLTLLAMSTTAGCARSLEAKAMKPTYRKPTAEMETVESLKIPTVNDIEEEKRQFLAARFKELFLAPGVANTNPRHVPSATLH